MKKIVQLFRHDLQRATRNVISVIVLFGVAIIPSFFAWFNVIASLDPFGNVKNLKVAVASADEGFKSDLFPLPVNIGAQVISTLRANSDLDWVFTTPDDAVEGTKSEAYYAAIVLPKDFSREMMTFLAPGAKPVEIDYYTNEKANALSPKITGEAASEVSTQINQSFTKTLSEVGLSLISSLATHLDEADSEAALVRIESSINQVATQLRAGANTADMFATLVGSTEPIVTSTSSLINSARDAVHDTAGAISGGAAAAQNLKSTLDSATASLAAAFSSSAGSYRELADRVDDLYDSLGNQVDSASSVLDGLVGEVDTHIRYYKQLRAGLEDALEEAEGISDPILRQAVMDGLKTVIASVDTVIERQEALRDRLERASSVLSEAASDSQAVRDEIIALVNAARDAIEGAETSYNTSLRPKLDQLAATLSSVHGSITLIGNDLSTVASSLVDGSGSLIGALDHAQQTVSEVARALEQTATHFDELATALQKATESGDLGALTQIIGSNPDILAGELTAPVGLKTIPVFEVDSFGAQMAPFYSVLGLWVGALLLSVLIRVDGIKEPHPLNRAQEYLGRYGIFFLLGFLQSSLVYLGLIGFVGIRPVHPFLLILAGWLMSFVFTMITYTMVVSFGEAGKAISVFLLVVQISGGGGAYPLAVLPQWFQNMSPFLPVTHATNAVRAAIAGIYEGDYWRSLTFLALFLVPTLLLGLVLRLPFVKLNEKMAEGLGSTKLFLL